MKIKRGFVGGIAALVFASGLAFFAASRNQGGPADIGGRTKMNIEKCLETLPASLDKTHRGVMAAMDSLDDCVSKTGDSARRIEFASLCAKKYLALDIDYNSEPVWRSRVSNYLWLAGDIYVIIGNAGATDAEKEDFFFGVFEKYKKAVVFSKCAEESGFEEWRRWKSSSLWLIDDLKNNLRFADEHLFDFFLKDIDEGRKPLVKKRFGEFYMSATNEIRMAEESLKSNKRKPPEKIFIKHRPSKPENIL